MSDIKEGKGHLTERKDRSRYENDRDYREYVVTSKNQEFIVISDGKLSDPEGFPKERDSFNPRRDYAELERRVGYTFKNRVLLERALTHSSALNGRERADYERLEFLGDAVLDLTVAHLLSELHPQAREGQLSKMRAALVNSQALASIARKLDIGPFIRLGRGEISSGGADRASILSDVVEALLGAVYYDASFETALEFVKSLLGSSLQEVTPFDPKTELQEVLHADGSSQPIYKLEMVEGPEHAPMFVVVVLVDGEVAGRGRGPTKKSAQQLAAAEALKKVARPPRVSNLTAEPNVIVKDALLQEKIVEEIPGSASEVESEANLAASQVIAEQQMGEVE